MLSNLNCNFLNCNNFYCSNPSVISSKKQRAAPYKRWGYPHPGSLECLSSINMTLRQVCCHCVSAPPFSIQCAHWMMGKKMRASVFILSLALTVSCSVSWEEYSSAEQPGNTRWKAIWKRSVHQAGIRVCSPYLSTRQTHSQKKVELRFWRKKNAINLSKTQLPWKAYRRNAN